MRSQAKVTQKHEPPKQPRRLPRSHQHEKGTLDRNMTLSRTFNGPAESIYTIRKLSRWHASSSLPLKHMLLIQLPCREQAALASPASPCMLPARVERVALLSDDSVGAYAWQRTSRKPGLQRHLSRRARSTGGAGGGAAGGRPSAVQGASNAATSGMSRKNVYQNVYSMCILSRVPGGSATVAGAHESTTL